MANKSKKQRHPIETLKGLLEMDAKECCLTREEAQQLVDEFEIGRKAISVLERM